MEPEAFLNSSSPAYEFIYNNESELEPLQYPLSISRFKVPRFANDLYTDNSAEYFTYSGAENSLIVTKQKDGRYKNFTLRAYSGDSFKFYFQVGSGAADSDTFYSGPLTTSGVYSTMTLYATQSGALANAMTFSAPTNNSSVYTLPSIQNLNWIRLYHSSVSGTTPYRIHQFMPRTLIQVDDLEADVIDVVTLRVSDSIVIGPNLIGDKTILGQKIVDGTLSGILMTDGTITGSKVVARTISGILITAGTIKGENIEAATISGSLITAGTITANNISAGTITFDKIASNTLTSGQIANGTITGQKIVDGTISGVLISNGTITGSKIQANTISGALITAGTITADKLNVTQLDAVAANMGSLTVNSGILLGTNGNIWAGAGSAAFPTTGLKIYTAGGVSRLTTYNGGAAQIDISSTGKLVAGSTVLDSTGVTVGSTSVALDSQQALKVKTNSTLVAAGGAGVSFYDGRIDLVDPIAWMYGARDTDNRDGIFIEGTVTAGDFVNTLPYLSISRNTTLAITTAGTLVKWLTTLGSAPIGRDFGGLSWTYADEFIYFPVSAYYIINLSFATAANVNLRINVLRGATHSSLLQSTPVSTAGGYVFNYTIMNWFTSGSSIRIQLVPSANTTLNVNAEGFPGPSPMIHIVCLNKGNTGAR